MWYLSNALRIEKMENREKQTEIPVWRRKALERLDVILILFELVLSVIFILMGHLTENIYLRGIGVGLIIAWVTSAIAHLYKKKMVKS